MDNLLDRLKRGEVIVGDGAWGTLLMQSGLAPGDAPENFNLRHPEIIGEIAALYLDAGAEILTTNTFGASPLKLEAHALQDKTEEINRKAVEAAGNASRGRAYISGSVGPTGRLLKPYGDAEPAQVRAGFEKQIRALASAGVDLICIETMTDLAEAVLAIRAARSADPQIPVMATMTFEETPRGFFTIMGISIAQAASALAEAGADIVGSNCGNGLEAMIRIGREFCMRTTLPIAIQANAGLPVIRDGISVYPETPGFFASRAGDLLAAGVQIIGGCCGTGPDHIRALRAARDGH